MVTAKYKHLRKKRREDFAGQKKLVNGWRQKRCYPNVTTIKGSRTKVIAISKPTFLGQETPLGNVNKGLGGSLI